MQDTDTIEFFISKAFRKSVKTNRITIFHQIWVLIISEAETWKQLCFQFLDGNQLFYLLEYLQILFFVNIISIFLR